MDVSAYAFAHGVRHTRATLVAWQREPVAVVGRWAAGAAAAAAGLLAAVWVVSLLDVRHQVIGLRPPLVVGDRADVAGVLGRNLLVLALHAMACVAGFIAGSSLPLQAGVGIDAGEAARGSDGIYHGLPVNMAARLCATAEAGEVLITQRVADACQGLAEIASSRTGRSTRRASRVRSK